MKCPKCGVEVVQEAVFCHKCGCRLDGQDVPAENNGNTENQASGLEKFKSAVDQVDNSQQQERELWSGGYSPKAMIGAWCACVAISIVLVTIGFVWVRNTWLWILLLLVIIGSWAYNLIMLAYRRMSFHYQLTNQRFIHENGIIRRVSDRIEVLDIDDITYEQGIVERMMGVGKIRIVSSDRTHPDITLIGIENVREVSGLFDDTRRDERRRRGLHIENI
jgi:membrane protein YdbS with pleckstrin-like domain